MSNRKGLFLSFMAGVAAALAIGAAAQTVGRTEQGNFNALYTVTLSGTTATVATVNVGTRLAATVPEYADNTAACAGGLTAGQLYNDTGVAAFVTSC